MDKKEYTYKDFLESEQTKLAAQNRDKLAAEKPKDFQFDSYKPSETVTQAQNLLNQHTQNKPGIYQSQWQTNLNDTLNKILNREKFTYDMNADALYQQYKNQYIPQGQQAMLDTMGQAQSMTGGYGNSYAQTAGQQAYHGYLQQLNNKVPELYQLALNQYNREGEDLYNQYGLFADREAQEYGRYRDQLGDYNAELDRLTNESRYQSEADYNRFMDQYNMAYGQYRDSVGDWQNALNRADTEYWNQYNKDYGQYIDDRNFGYGQYRDQMSDAQWQAEFDEAIRQYNISRGIAKGTSAGGTGGGTGGRTGGGAGTFDSKTLAMQKKLNAMGANIAEDGIWGNETQEAYEKYYGTNVEAEVREMAAAGDHRNTIMRYIDAQYQDGNISESEYIRLMSSYASVGL